MPLTPSVRSGRSRAAARRTGRSCRRRRALPALALLPLSSLLTTLALPSQALADAAGAATGTGTDIAVAPGPGLFGPTDAMPDMPGAMPGRDLTASFGTTYWHGDFGTPSDAQIVTGLFSVRYRADRFRLTATLPLMRIDSAAPIFTGIDGTPLIVTPDRPIVDRRRDGLGDLTLGVSYSLPELPRLSVELEMQGRLKLPTASASSGLSTGRTDASFGIDAYRPIGRVTPYASVRYRVFGGPRGWTLHDGIALTTGAIVNVTSATYAVVSYSYAHATSDLIGDAHQMLAALSMPVSDRLRLTVLGSAGLSHGAPALSMGASIGLLF